MLSTVFSLQSAKAWVAFVGAILTAVVGTLDVVPKWLMIVTVALTAAGTWLTANAPAPEPTGEHAAP